MRRPTNIIPVLAAIIQDEEGRVLIARRRDHISQGSKWEFPGGKLRPGETPEDCLIREIEEELGITIIILSIFAAVNHAYPDKNILLLAYKAKYVSGEIRLTDHQAARWIEPQKMSELDFSEADVPLVKRLIEESANQSKSG
ncbi:MAG: (deoxy)nucleoside triphosphate pyrophosphohydrolase [Calditrichia bacterium]